LAVSERLRAPLDCRDAAVCAARHGTAFGAAAGFSAAQWLDLLQGIDALRRPDRLETLHAVLCAFCATDAGADARPDAGDDARPDGTVAACDRVYAHATQLRAALLRVDYRSLAAGGAEGMVTRVRTARIGALEEALRGGEGH
jgi:tRNA nucleotidyltransferase (CCA-adding enzyme)